MALSKQFNAQLDRLAQLVTADRSGQAVEIAKAVAAQAEADQAAIVAAHQEAVDAKATADAALQDANDEIAALTAKLDELGAPAAVEDPTTVQPVSDPAPAPETPAPAPAAAVDGSAPSA